MRNGRQRSKIAATKFSFFDISTSDRGDFRPIIEIALFVIFLFVVIVVVVVVVFVFVVILTCILTIRLKLRRVEMASTDCQDKPLTYRRSNSSLTAERSPFSFVVIIMIVFVCVIVCFILVSLLL